MAGGEPVTITVRSTKHGPLLSDRSSEPADGGAVCPPWNRQDRPDPRCRRLRTSTLDPAEPGVPTAAQASPYAVALRWTALDPGRTGRRAVRAQPGHRLGPFRRRPPHSSRCPSQNIVYADVDGNIGYQSPGRIPVRGKGDGTWPAPGLGPRRTTGRGFIPFAELPSVLQPGRGLRSSPPTRRSSATQYQHLLTRDWSYGYRSQRIIDMIRERIGDGQDQRRGHPADAVRQPQRVRPDPGAGAAGGVHRGRHRRPRPGICLPGWDFQQPARLGRGRLLQRDLATPAAADLRRAAGGPTAQTAATGGSRWSGRCWPNPTSSWWDDADTAAGRDARRHAARRP